METLGRSAKILSPGERLALADPEHLGAADRADALSCRLAILHSDSLGALDFPLGAAFYAVSLHSGSPPLFLSIKPISFEARCQ